MATQLIVDLYGCDAAVLNDVEALRALAKKAVDALGAQIVEECVHAFEPIGISYIAVITTSHFSVHTWPEYGYAAVDVFSCAEEIPEKLSGLLAKAFGAQRQSVRAIEREILPETDAKGGEQTCTLK